MVEKPDRPPRTPHYNVEAKWGSCQMGSISHHPRSNFSPSTLDSGGLGGGALTTRCAEASDHRPPSPEVVRNTFHLPSRCALSSLFLCPFVTTLGVVLRDKGSFRTLGVALREGGSL